MTAKTSANAAAGPGDPAPDFLYRDGAGKERRLSELWAVGPALVVWLRHFG